MTDELNKIQDDARRDIASCDSRDALEQVRVRYLGRKGILTEFLKGMKGIPDEERPRVGMMANAVKSEITRLFEARSSSIAEREGQKRTLDLVDTTLPGVRRTVGTIHPVTQVIYRICDIFISLGFRVVEGPEIETEHYNFEALNIPLEHPSRDAFDTFYLASGEKEDKKTRGERLLLRSHTSPVQARFMEKHRPPFSIVIPGKVFRPDATDASHSFMFHQVEGLAVSDDITFADLKGVLTTFSRQMFGPKTKMRFRPHFFPFTEPSAEVDISCFICGGTGCRVCSNKGWLEILGAGMVNPRVFKAVGYDPDRYQGFAFGMGVERIAMLKYGIDDIRLFFENDIRFLKQF